MGKTLKPNTEKVLADRYYLRKPDGQLLETEFEQPCRRIADFVALAHMQKHGDFRHLNSVDELNSIKFNPLDDAAEEKVTSFFQDTIEARQWAERFFQLHYNQVFAANSPTWFNAGNPYQKKMLSACFLLHVPNDIKGIFKAVQDGAIIGKYGGGIGMDFSQLSPRGARTNSGGIASGSISFMQPFQTTGLTVAQGGRRRMAEMGMLAVWHPEILCFIDAKKKTGPERLQWLIDTFGVDYEQARDIAIGLDWLRIENRGKELEKEEWITPFCALNISVKVTREFMDAVHKNELFMLRQAIIEDPENGPRAKKVRYEPWRGPVYDHRGEKSNDGNLGENTDGLVVYKDGIAYVKARELWYERLMKSAWASAEPGIMFDDQVNDDNPVKSLGPIHNSNPCGEYFQVDYNSCNLGSINAGKFFTGIREGYVPERDWSNSIDWCKLAEVSRIGARFLDYVISMNEYPIPEITEVTNLTRPTGLGIMGVADLLLDLEVPYGSPLAVKISEALQQWIQYHAWVESTTLAKEFGSFPELENNRPYFDKKMQFLTEAIKSHPAFGRCEVFDLFALYQQHGLRNCHVTVIAPTGTISLIDECSSGIEPIFAFAFKRQDTIGVRWYYEARAQKYKELHGDAPLPVWFKDANSTTPEEHVLMQAAFQKWCDNAISKTCNMPEDSTVEDVAKIYDLAWKVGLKGCTVYRDGSRHGVLIREDKVKKTPITKEEVKLPDPKPIVRAGELVVAPRPEWLEGGTRVVPDGHEGKLYVTVNHEPNSGRVFEVLLRENAGNEWIELTGRLISLLLRSNVPVKEIRQQLKRVAGQCSIFYNSKLYTSPVQLLDAVIFEQAAPYFAAKVKGQALVEEPNPIVDESETPKRLVHGQKCPQCGGELRAANGCFECAEQCGYSKCK